jgi:hypothetical protein
VTLICPLFERPSVHTKDFLCAFGLYKLCAHTTDIYNSANEGCCLARRC